MEINHSHDGVVRGVKYLILSSGNASFYNYYLFLDFRHQSPKLDSKAGGGGGYQGGLCDGWALGKLSCVEEMGLLQAGAENQSLGRWIGFGYRVWVPLTWVGEVRGDLRSRWLVMEGFMDPCKLAAVQIFPKNQASPHKLRGSENLLLEAWLPWRSSIVFPKWNSITASLGKSIN